MSFWIYSQIPYFGNCCIIKQMEPPSSLTISSHPQTGRQIRLLQISSNLQLEKRATLLTIWLPLLAENMDIHGREDVGMYFTQVLSRVLVAGQHRMSVPVSPVQRVPKQSQSERMWKGSFNHCLPNRAQGGNHMQLKLHFCFEFCFSVV